METAKIEIKGPAGSGKSCLAWAIKHILAQHGVTVQISGCEDEEPGEMDQSWSERLRSLQGKPISVTTIQTKP